MQLSLITIYIWKLLLIIIGSAQWKDERPKLSLFCKNGVYIYIFHYLCSRSPLNISYCWQYHLGYGCLGAPRSYDVSWKQKTNGTLLTPHPQNTWWNICLTPQELFIFKTNQYITKKFPTPPPSTYEYRPHLVINDSSLMSIYQKN